MIPKVIHYCWFGRSQLPNLAIKCIDSWKKYAPDYEIKEWNESNFNLDICNYVSEAYNEKMWAFVSDYARFWILHNEGGVYFDTDVELVKPIDDILKKGAFFGLERRENCDESKSILVAPGLGMAAEARNKIYKEILDYYEKIHFVNTDGTYNKTTVVTHVTTVLENNGMDKQQFITNKNSVIKVKEILIYPWDYFCPMSYSTGLITITDNTRSIHHYTASWKTNEEIKMKKIEESVSNLFGRKNGRYITKALVLPCRIKMKIKKFGITGSIKLILKKLMSD